MLSWLLWGASLLLICIVAFCIRLFAVVRWESVRLCNMHWVRSWQEGPVCDGCFCVWVCVLWVLSFVVGLCAVVAVSSYNFASCMHATLHCRCQVIHEYDPYFNYRTTKFLTSEGFGPFINWFDDRGWYPLGRIVGGTLYPGLMVTAAALQAALTALSLPIDVRNACVFLAPTFASATAVASYLLTKEVTRRASSALLAAALVAIVPSYISRSVAGSYDNEGVAIFALVFTFFLWARAVRTGRIAWAAATAVAYFYMVAAWGGYIFIINIIPLHAVVLVLSGRFSSRLYIAYSVFYVLGTLLSMQVPFVRYRILPRAETAASHAVFLSLQRTFGRVGGGVQ